MRAGWWCGTFFAFHAVAACSRTGVWFCPDTDDCNFERGAAAGTTPSAGGTHGGATNGGATNGGATGGTRGGAAGVSSGGGTTDPCKDVACYEPPRPSCSGDSLIDPFGPGTCQRGSCQFGATTSPCPYGCETDHCRKADEVVQISAGGDHTCARLARGVAMCWGSNSVGELGTGNTAPSLPPTLVLGLSDLVDVSSGRAHSCAVRADGTAYCWGFNRHGRLGDGSSTPLRPAPVAVVGLADATRISAAGQHSCALRASGDVVCWGNNLEGALGDGSGLTSSVPLAVVGIRGASGLDATGEVSIFGHSCAMAGGRVACWGFNGHGELATGDFETRNTASYVPGLSGVAGVALGAFRSAAFTNSGSVLRWGGDWLTQGHETSPVPFDGVSSVIGLSLGDEHGCALERSGKARCWGANSNGVLGDGSTVDSATPVEVVGLTEAREISAGSHHSCARVRDGAVYCWGDNANGALGHPGIEASSTPLAVPGL